MTVTWTKSWSSSDDGTVLSGNDIGTIQSDVDGYCATFAGTQTFTGNKTFSGNIVFGSNVYSGTTDITSAIAQLNGGIASANELVTYDNSVVVNNGNVVYYR